MFFFSLIKYVNKWYLFSFLVYFFFLSKLISAVTWLVRFASIIFCLNLGLAYRFYVQPTFVYHKCEICSLFLFRSFHSQLSQFFYVSYLCGKYDQHEQKFINWLWWESFNFAYKKVTLQFEMYELFQNPLFDVLAP